MDTRKSRLGDTMSHDTLSVGPCVSFKSIKKNFKLFTGVTPCTFVLYHYLSTYFVLLNKPTKHEYFLCKI